jgi:hypothetical protein
MEKALKIMNQMTANKTVKVELALVNDVEKMVGLLYQKKAEGRKIQDEMNAAAKEFNKLLQKADSATKEYESLLNKSKGLDAAMTRSLTDLGLTIKDSGDLINLITAIADLDEVKMDVQDAIKFYAR